jgi:hypothetical protein
LYDDLWPGIMQVGLPKALLKCFASTLDGDPENRILFTDLLELLRSTDGCAITCMKLGLQDLELSFDEVEADLRLLMPSSRYASLYTGHGAYSPSAYNEYEKSEER